MKKLLQNISNGKTIIEELPRPQCKKGHILIKTSKSLISSGTERMLVDFGKANILDKALQQPEKVKMVLEKIKTDGLLTTADAVKTKLDQPIAMGYSNVGVVEEVGDGVTEFSVGDRVVSNGSHAELVCVPKNLASIIPENVKDEDAVYTVVSSIALQGVRLLQPTIGENIVVMGLGLIGLISIQILKANGCNVLGMDFDSSKVEISKKMGIESLLLEDGIDPITIAKDFSKNIGIDGVIITASTKSQEPIHNAAQMCRQKGRIILVGVVGLNLQRNDFYEKELSFSVSCSYGPGRYDKSYEENGVDYPIGYVRWTEKRNFDSVLDMISKEALNFDYLKSREFKFEDAHKAYELLLNNKSSLGIMLNYDVKNIISDTAINLEIERKAKISSEIIIGAIGAGNYAGRVLLPIFKKHNSNLHTISSSQGASSGHYARKLGFLKNTTDNNEIIRDNEINSIIIATQHDSHAKFISEGLLNGKNIFCEKPLAITTEQLNLVKDSYKKSSQSKDTPILMIGFNRRFSPFSIIAKKALAKNMPIAITYTCNAGELPLDSWIYDLKKGGGRIIGEACHFIDLCRFFVGAKIISVNAHNLKEENSKVHSAIISLTFENGSIASINYFSNGSKAYPKERIDIFQGGKTISINNFVNIKSYGFKGISNKRYFRQNKGQDKCVKSFIKSIENGLPSPILFDEIIEVSECAIEASNILHNQ